MVGVCRNSSQPSYVLRFHEVVRIQRRRSQLCGAALAVVPFWISGVPATYMPPTGIFFSKRSEFFWNFLDGISNAGWICISTLAVWLW